MESHTPFFHTQGLKTHWFFNTFEKNSVHCPKVLKKTVCLLTLLQKPLKYQCVFNTFWKCDRLRTVESYTNAIREFLYFSACQWQCTKKNATLNSLDFLEHKISSWENVEVMFAFGELLEAHFRAPQKCKSWALVRTRAQFSQCSRTFVLHFLHYFLLQKL